MIDSHCHLERMERPEEVVEEAMKRGMKGIVTSAPAPSDIAKNLELSGKFRGFVISNIGLHPTDALSLTAADIRRVEEFMERDEVRAIGEIGLDYYHIRDRAERKETVRIFEMLVEFANSVSKPVVIHCRDAWKDCFSVLEKADSGAMLHCFTGDERILEKALDMGFMISLSTLIVKSPKLEWLAEKVPLESLLLETDAPWLDPFSNELKNRPWNISYSAELIAGKREMLAEEVLQTAEKNAREFFGF